MPRDVTSETTPRLLASSNSRLILARALANRSSIPPRRLTGPGPDSDDMALMLAATAAAPSHGGLRNFRFVIISPEGRSELAELFVKAEAETNPSAREDDLARAREKAMHAPTLVLMIARAFIDHPDIPLLEQHVSAGAALGNFLNAAHSLGFGAMAVSGEKMQSSVLRAAFCLADYEQALCFIAIGTPNGSARTKARPDPSDLCTIWPQG